MSAPGDILGLWYPNNYAEPFLLMPAFVAYTMLISGAAMLFLGYVMYLLGRPKNYVSYLTVIGLSLFAVVLLGPLAESRAPDNASRMMTSPRIMPTEGNPGISLIALQGSAIWTAVVVLSVAFILMYFSYPLYRKAMETKTPVLRSVYKAFSLGVSSEKTYEALRIPLKALAIIGALLLTTWLVYPSTFLLETFNFIWRNTMLLPIIFFVDYILLGFCVLALAVWAHEEAKLTPEVLGPLRNMLTLILLSAIGVLTLQVFIWSIQFGGSVYYTAFGHLYGLIGTVIALYLIGTALTILSARYTSLLVLASVVGIIGAFINKWNFIIKAQEVSYTGMGIISAHFHSAEYAVLVGLFGAGLFVALLLSSLFPLGFELKRGESV